MSILITNARVLTMTDSETKCPVKDILVEDGRIQKIAEHIQVSGAKVIDGQGQVAMPGLINAHTHLGMSFLRNYADDMALMDWLENKIWPIEAHLKAEDIYWGSLLSMMELVKTGTTSFIDMYFFMDEVARAAEKIGMRGVLTRGLIGSEDENRQALKEAVALQRSYGGPEHGLLSVMLAPHAPYTCPDDYVQEILDYASQEGVGIHTHLAETSGEVEMIQETTGKTPVAHWADLGLLDHHVVAAHCVHLTEEDEALVADKPFYPVYNPASNLKLASGFAPVTRWLKKGMKPALGTDGPSSNNHTNMWEEIHFAATVNKAVEEDPTAVTAYEALKMATVHGAYAMGMQEELGTLEVGKKADIILVDLTGIHMTPLHNVVSALAYSVQGTDVKTVIIDGDVVYRDGKFLSLDEKEVIQRVQECTEALFHRAGER